MTALEPPREARAAAWPALLAWALTALGCLAAYAVLSVALGAGSGPVSATWQNVLSIAFAAACAVPLHRWVGPRVRELADERRDPYQAVRSISSDDAAPSSTAEAIAAAMNLPWVEVETSGTGGVDTFGAPTADAETVELEIIYRGDVFGVIRASERRRGSHLTKADLHVLRELATQVGIRMAAENATMRADEARAELVTAREEERRRMRRDLHDGLAPSLASIQLQLKATQRRLPDEDPLRSSIAEIIEDMRHATADLRRLVYELRPPLLDELGLAGALERQFDSVTRPDIVVSVASGSLPAAAEVAAFRIAAEAVHNAVKHSGATQVRVHIATDGSELQILVEDDGVGIRPDVVPGVGLTAMRERAEELGGVLTVHSLGGHGTRIEATIGLTR